METSTTTTTEGIAITVQPFALSAESDEAANRFAFGYRITITNQTPQPVQLLMHYWVIIDGDGERREVRGPGLAGQQHSIEPGTSLTLTDGAELPTNWGTMEGGFRMRRGDGSCFAAYVDRFFLVAKQLTS